MSRKPQAAGGKDARRGSRTKKNVERGKLVRGLLDFAFPQRSLFTKDQFHGNIKWDPDQLAMQALIWSWHETKMVTDGFEQSKETCDQLGLNEISQTYTGFMNALVRYRAVFDVGLHQQLHTLAEEIGGRFFRDKKWLLLGFDGSRATAPRTVANEVAFCAPTHGQGEKARYNQSKSKRPNQPPRQKSKATQPAPPEPQIWITLLWHMSLRLPWTWRLGPSNSSERRQVQEILGQEEFPANTLFCGDAGFVGYPLWSDITKSGQEFLVRIGANVNLLSERSDVKRLEGGIVLCWPKDRMHSGDPPLRLRLVRVQIGKTKMWMLTSVLDDKKLSNKDIARYYKMRWLLEVEFRGLKQTIDKSKLRCRNPERLLVELDWSLHAMAFAELIALRAQIPGAEKAQAPVPYDPKHRSLANTLRVLRRYMRTLKKLDAPGSLNECLENAVVQKYKNNTNKRARYHPKNKDHKPLGDPTVSKLTPEQRKKLRQLELQTAT